MKAILINPNWPGMILLAFHSTDTPNSSPLPFAGRSLFSNFLQVSARLNLLALNQFVFNFWKRWQIKRWRIRNWVSLTSHFTVTSTEVTSLKRKAENAGNELERRGPNPFSNFNLQPPTAQEHIKKLLFQRGFIIRNCKLSTRLCKDYNIWGLPARWWQMTRDWIDLDQNYLYGLRVISFALKRDNLTVFFLCRIIFSRWAFKVVNR